MRGDFTRGHRPDGHRGRRYTRGLLQQRRLLLDSDVNAMTDALHERLRDLASDLGCPKGSPDLGFLVTPGRLLAVCEDLGCILAKNNVTVYRDYSRKYLDRFPSVFLAADQGAAGSATIRMRHPADNAVRFWVRSETATQVNLTGGVALNAPAGDPFQPVDVNLAGPLDELQIDLGAGEQIWIALIEEVQPAGDGPSIAVNEGRFYLAGLPLVCDAGGLYPDVSFPLDPDVLVTAPQPPLAVNDRVVAFLEGWERHVTAIEDAGLLERALGGNLDTTTRGEAVGQVKLVRVPAGPLDSALLSQAIFNPVVATGTLRVTTPAAPPDPDPCALPVEEGYTGPDNRLYRFEVHEGGPLGETIFKWSRDNGSELFAAIDAPAANRLVFASSTALRAGDLVEVLNEAVDLGDRAPAQILAPGRFQRPERAAGPAAVLEQASGPPPANGVAFVLRQVSGVGDVNLDADVFGPFPGGKPIKVRRWHGRIETVAGTTEYALEHGIVIELAGAFSAGDYWQYEARVAGDNHNGAPVLTPHGPLRVFAPLALLQFDGAGAPLRLLNWLDDRFNPICELNADDLPFDGNRVGVDDCDTVQEALECLFERESGGCCEFTLDPDGADTAERIRDILDESELEVTICFNPGVYPFRTSLSIVGRKVVLKGCPRAVLEASTVAEPMIRLRHEASLRLEELILFGPNQQENEVFIEMDNDSRRLEASAVGFLASAHTSPPAIRVAGLVPQPIDPNDPVRIEDIQPEEGDWPEVDVAECVFVGGWVLSAPQLSALRMRDSACYCFAGGVSVRVAQAFQMSGVCVGITANLEAPGHWTANALLTAGDALLDQLPPFSNLAPEVFASVAVRAGLVLGGSVENCIFCAGVGAVFTEARTLRLERNFYRVTHFGLVFVSARGTLVSGEQIRALGGDDARMGIGIVLEAQPIGGDQIGEFGLTVTGAVVDGFDTGIGLSTHELVAIHRLIGVRVTENRITANRVGIIVGEALLMAYPGEFGNVLIADNEIRSNDDGIVANAQFHSDQFLSSRDIRIESNWILAIRGILALSTHAARLRIVANRIGLLPVSLTAGVVAVNTVDAVIEGNLVELSSDRQVDSDSTAFFLVRGSDARLSNNVSRTNQPIMGLRVDSHHGLRADGNDFGPGNNQLSAVTEVVFRNNRTQGFVEIRATSSGQIIGNRFDSFQGDAFPGSLRVTDASQLWQVSSNYADFGIEIYPSTAQRFVFIPRRFAHIPESFAAISSRPIGFLEFTGLRDIAVRAEDEGFANEVKSISRRSEDSAFEFATGDASLPLALDNAAWLEAWTNGLTRFVAGGLAESVAVFSPNDFATALLQITEQPYQALVEGNFSGSLTVGFMGGGNSVALSLETTVQVVANRARSDLFVQDYRHRVVANNAAGSYSGISVVSQVGPIHGPNLNT